MQPCDYTRHRSDRFKHFCPSSSCSFRLVVPDVDAHCLHARNEGAVVVHEPHDNPGYPGRGYTALDPEGNVWSFGSYDPWAPIPDEAG